MSGTVMKRRPFRRVAAAGLALSLAVLAAWGCGQSGEKDPAGQSNLSAVPKPPDPGSKQVKIDPTQFQVDLRDVKLSKSAKEKVQWHNQSDEPLLLLFQGAPLGEVIARREWSAVHHVCVACDTGAYVYSLYRQQDGQWVAVAPSEPNEPQVSVGD